MALASVSDLLRESENMLDEVLRIRTVIQQSKDETAAEILRRIRCEAVAAQILPVDAITDQQLAENANLLSAKDGFTDDDLQGQLPEIALSKEEIQRFEEELAARATGGISTKVGGKLSVKGGSKVGGKDAQLQKAPQGASKKTAGATQNKKAKSTKPANNVANTAKKQANTPPPPPTQAVLSASNSTGSDLDEASTSCRESVVLLSAIGLEHKEGSTARPYTIVDDDYSANGDSNGVDIFSEGQEVDELLDGLLDYHEQMEKDQGARSKKTFQTELPTISESHTTSADASYSMGTSAILPPKPHYNPNDIYNPNFTVLLTEEENARVEQIIEQDIPATNAFKPSTEDIRRDIEICAQLSMLVPIDRSDMIYAPTFTTETVTDETGTTRDVSAETKGGVSGSGPRTHTSVSTTVTLSEPSHMTDRGKELWLKHTKGLPLNEQLDIFVPRLKSGVPDYIKEQRRDNILTQYNNAITRCLEEIKSDTSLVHLSTDKLKEMLADFYMTPTNFDLVGDLQKAMDDNTTYFPPLRSMGVDDMPLTPQLMKKPEDCVPDILPPEDREKLANILVGVREHAMEVIESDSYYSTLNIEEYVKNNTALHDLNMDQDLSPRSPDSYVPDVQDGNPGITDPVLLKIYMERQKAKAKEKAKQVESGSVDDSCNDFSNEDYSEDYDFDGYNKGADLLTENEIDREVKRLTKDQPEGCGKLYTILQDGTGMNTEVVRGVTETAITNFSLHQTATSSIAASVDETRKGKGKKPATTAEQLASKSKKLEDKIQSVINRYKPTELGTEMNKVYDELHPEDIDVLVSGTQTKQHIQTLRKQGINLLDLDSISVNLPDPSILSTSAIAQAAAPLTSSGRVSERSSAKPILTRLANAAKTTMDACSTATGMKGSTRIPKIIQQ